MSSDANLNITEYGRLIGCSNSVENLIIPNGVKDIKYNIFNFDSALRTVTFPSSIEEISCGTFIGCDRLETIVLSEGLKSIGYKAFSGCVKLRELIIPEGATDIEERAFYDCHSLKKVVLPSSVQFVGKEAFCHCHNLVDFIIKGNSRIIKKDFFGSDYPPGLVNHVGELYPHMNDYALKQYVLKADVWKKLSDDLKIDLILNRMNKNLSYTFSECINSSEADDLAGKLICYLSTETPEEPCTSVGLFLIAFSNKLSKSVLLEMAEKIRRIKGGRKIVKLIKEDPILANCIADCEVEKACSVPGQKVIEILTKEKRTIGSIENEFWKKYALSNHNLPVLTDSFGKEVEHFVLEYLLLFPGSLDFEKLNILLVRRNKPADILPEKVKLPNRIKAVLETIDKDSFHNALVKLADICLGTRSFCKKTHMAYPICRYADENLIKYLIKNSVKWKKSLSGKGEKFMVLRLSILYSDTRAAMLYADKNNDLKLYAYLRSISETNFRMKYILDLGLNPDGIKEYDLGIQTVKVQLQNDLSFVVVQSDPEKQSKALPRKGVDPDKYQAALADFRELKESVKNIFKKQCDLLLERFLSGDKMPAEIWKESFINNPVLHTIAQMFVWGQDDHYFTVKDKEAIDCLENPYEINKSKICLAHPMEMPSAEAENWRNLFVKKGIKQPFAQIWEPAYNPEEIKKDRYSGCTVRFKYLVNRSKHGIDAYIWDPEYVHDYILLKDCKIDYSIENYEYGNYLETKAILGDFTFQKFTRQVNHIVYYLDKMTVFSRIEKDDPSIKDVLPYSTFAQVQEYIEVANKTRSQESLAILLEEKNRRWPDYNGAEELFLD